MTNRRRCCAEESPLTSSSSSVASIVAISEPCPAGCAGSFAVTVWFSWPTVCSPTALLRLSDGKTCSREVVNARMAQHDPTLVHGACFRKINTTETSLWWAMRTRAVPRTPTPIHGARAGKEGNCPRTSSRIDTTDSEPPFDEQSTQLKARIEPCSLARWRIECRTPVRCSR